MISDYYHRITGTWRNTTGGASTASSTDSTDDVYGSGDDEFGHTSTSVYCDKEEEEEIPIEEEPFGLPTDEELNVIRNLFAIIREPP